MNSFAVSVRSHRAGLFLVFAPAAFHRLVRFTSSPSNLISIPLVEGVIVSFRHDGQVIVLSRHGDVAACLPDLWKDFIEHPPFKDVGSVRLRPDNQTVNVTFGNDGDKLCASSLTVTFRSCQSFPVRAVIPYSLWRIGVTQSHSNILRHEPGLIRSTGIGCQDANP